MTVKFTRVEGENTGLQLRLAGRAAEVTALNHQLSQASKQFDHFQEATAAQRSEERRTTDQRIGRLEQESADLQRKLVEHQRLVAQHATRLVSLTDENKRLQEVARDAHEQAVAARSERDQFSYQVKDLTAVRQELRGELTTAQQSLSNARAALAGQEKETSLLTARLDAEQKKGAGLEAERLALIQDNATLRAAEDSAKKTDGIEVSRAKVGGTIDRS